MECWWDVKQAVDVDASDDRDQDAQQTDAAVCEDGAVNQAGHFLQVMRSGVLGNIPDKGRANTEVKDAIVAGQRKHQNPKTKRCISKPMENERRHEESDQDVQPG